jgi:hypothetical protein
MIWKNDAKESEGLGGRESPGGCCYTMWSVGQWDAYYARWSVGQWDAWTRTGLIGVPQVVDREDVALKRTAGWSPLVGGGAVYFPASN